MAVLDAIKPMIVQILVVIIVLVMTYIVAAFFHDLFEKYFRRSSRRLKIDATKFAFLKHTITGIIYIIGISIAIYTIPSLRAVSVSLLAGAGVIAIIIGFASKQAFSNIVSGLFIVIFRPFRVGDWIKFGTISGEVEDINLRHTVIRTWKNTRMIVPNSVISQEKIENKNIVDEKTCQYVEFRIGYDSDIDKAISIMQDEVVKHPDFLDIRTEKEKKDGHPSVRVKLISFGDSSVNLRAYVWAKTPGDAWNIGTDLNKSIKQRFDAEGIEIPYPYRTIVYKKNET